jgi:hypothetical protein
MASLQPLLLLHPDHLKYKKNNIIKKLAKKLLKNGLRIRAHPPMGWRSGADPGG